MTSIQVKDITDKQRMFDLVSSEGNILIDLKQGKNHYFVPLEVVVELSRQLP